MGTLVCLHAHPDDESISTGGTIARAKAEGHRVVLVVATNGDHGEVPDDLAPDETLVDRRRCELRRSAEVLGIDRVVWLGYADSGMTGWEQNEHPDAFMKVPVTVAAEQLAALLVEEHADVLTTYDWHGNYGHPDHIHVHRVGAMAADIARTPAVFEATMNRDAMVRFFVEARANGQMPADDDWDPDGPADDGNPFGTPESELTHAVDVRPYVHLKRASIECHASQVSDAGFFISMPEESFANAFGTEWYIKVGADHPLREGWLFE
jgi:LmbE family N-acetylglucosaminyl deacetylase